jgi:hypothetical protein
MQERSRVSVLVRGARTARGVCTGHLLAFDKHFNLVRAPHHTLSTKGGMRAGAYMHTGGQVVCMHRACVRARVCMRVCTCACVRVRMCATVC